MKLLQQSLSARNLTSTLRKEFMIVAVAIVVLGLFNLFSSSQSGFRSSELMFTDPTAGGMHIVPASCPSDPHYSGECSVAIPTPTPSGYCSISSNPTYLTESGTGSTLAWYTSDGTFTYLGVTATAMPTNISISSVGSVARSGSVEVAPSQTTTYTLTGNYTYLGVTAGSFACSTVVNVVQSCPAGQVYVNGQCVYQCPGGQHAVGQVCICDDTNYPPDAQGQCTMQQCPTGYQWVNGQCVAVSQCQLPTSCADSTHVLNQCTGEATDCEATYGAGWFCSGGACRRPAPPVASISAVPSLVPPNRTTNIAWSSSNTRSCSVSGTNGDGGSDAPWIGINGSQVSRTITAQTSYTLTCVGLDGSTIKRTVTVNIIPNWNEE